MQTARKITNVFRIPSKRTRRKAISQVTDGADRLRAQANAILEEISLARTAEKLALHMSQNMIRVGWVVVLFFHVFNSVYSGMLAYLYYFMAKPKMAYYVQLLRMMPQHNYEVVIALYACICAANVYSALKMLLYSLYYRRLVFRKAINPEAENVGSDPVNEEIPMGCFRALKRFASGLGRAISARGEWFDGVLVAREIVEVASQTVQAHSCSFLISSVWINQVFCGLIFLNGMATAIVHHSIVEKVGLRRLYSTAIDLSLDFAWGFIIPCRIIFVYVTMYIKNKHNFPESFSYSDTMQIKAILECNQFFMVSWLDTITTTLPYLNMLSGLRSVKFLIQHDMEVVRMLSTIKVQPLQLTVGPSTAATKSGDTITPGPTPEAVSEELCVDTKLTMCGRWLVKCIMALIPVVGVFVLITSITASGIFFGEDTCAVGCKLRMHPWFTHKCACSVMEINCFERELSITEDIRGFNNLMRLELYNSTVAKWPSTASLSLPYVPSLVTLFVIRSRLVGGLPDGLTTNFSSNIVDVEFVASDFDGPLPSDLNDKWPSVAMLYIEHSGLEEIPSVVSNKALTDLSLIDNNISVISEDVELSSRLMYVMLDRNPLERIPDSFQSLQDLFFLTFQHTNVKDLPPWLRQLQSKAPKLKLQNVQRTITVTAFFHSQ
ncbi:hypothetical protein PHYBOEH_007646 [Phytophthora boehmeriae]|uniref:Uncharacterized protein n=1 Tax=Phytophthora boehmeriae TaxID=109152 RepID=A0A8T1W6N6_9STRA|nr:hypothetical protein PHYBOEH_007646 [Phytophthora boehmeriae]